MNNKTSRFWLLGLLWGLLAGIMYSIISDEAVLVYFLKTSTLLQILAFVVGGLIFSRYFGKFPGSPSI